MLVTIVHTAVSVVMLLVGFPLLYGLSRGRAMSGLAGIFIFTAVATAASGFLFAFVKFLPSHAFSVLALLTLAPVIYARYVAQLHGRWRAVYGAGLAFNLYLDVFVAIAQAFAKVPVLHPLAPTIDAPAFAVAQITALLAFLAIGIGVVRGLRSGADADSRPPHMRGAQV